MNPQAENLNKMIMDSPAVFELLSEKGRNIYFPKLGIPAQAAEAKGKKINATVGIALEDDGTPMRLKAISEKVLLPPGEVFSYASSYGKPELRQKWKEMIHKKNPSFKGKISDPVVTCALTHGLSMVGYMFINPGDTILLPDKFWGNYKLVFENAYGAKLETFNSFKSGGFDVDAMKEALEKKPKALLLNFPNNPAGYTPTESEAKLIAMTLKAYAGKGEKLLVILDDAYFGLVYEPGVYKESMFSLVSGLHDDILAVKLDGITKEEYAWGFRVGFITYGIREGTGRLYQALEEKTAGAVRGSISNAPHLSQSLAYHAFRSAGYDEDKASKFRIMKERYDEVKKVVSDRKYTTFRPLPFNSGYFMCLELDADAEKVRKTLLAKYDTGTISVGKLLRIAFSSVPKSKIRELFDNIDSACKEVKNV
jgi:aspartate/methionine/tyrosine aminotransferase